MDFPDINPNSYHINNTKFDFILKIVVLFVNSQKVAVYLLISLIKTWETFVNSSMSFLYIGYDVFPSIALHTTFWRVCFRFVQTTVFLLASLLCFIINWPQTFINAYKLYFVLVHTVYIALENVELVPVLFQFSAIFFVFWKIEIRVEHQ